MANKRSETWRVTATAPSNEFLCGARDCRYSSYPVCRKGTLGQPIRIAPGGRCVQYREAETTCAAATTE